MGTIVKKAAGQFVVVPGEFAFRQTPKLDAICGIMGTIVKKAAGQFVVVRPQPAAAASSLPGGKRPRLDDICGKINEFPMAAAGSYSRSS